MASKAFERALAKKKDAADRLNTAKKAKPNQFSVPEIDDGTYIARISARDGVTKNNDPFVCLDWSIIEGEFEGKSHNATFFLSNEDPEREQRNWDSLSRALQVLSGDDAEAWDVDNLGDILDQIASNNPVCKIGIKNWTGRNGSKGLNTYFNELVDAPTNGQAEVDEDEDIEDDEGEDVEDEEEDELPPPEKGELFLYKPPRARKAIEVEVVTVNKSAETCNLKDDDGTKYTSIPWDSLQELQVE